MHKIVTISLMLVCVAGCRLGPRYVPPQVNVPETWKESSDECAVTKPFEGRWWEVFDDDILNGLEEQAILNNPNLYSALDRVAQARAIAGIDRSALYPHVDLTSGYTNTGTLFKIYLPSGTPTTLFTALNDYRIHELQYTLPFTMSYELDLWGKLRGQYDSAYYAAQAQEENFQSAFLTLTADVAKNYFQARALDSQLVSLQKNVALLREYEVFARSRFDKGLGNYLDVASATQQLATTEARYYENVRQRKLQENALATLLGVPAPSFSLDTSPLQNIPPTIPAGIPSDILLQRPDIAAAERNMASQHAMIGVAYAMFLPSIELTGTLGFSSPDLGEFLHWKSRLWAMAANASQSIFDAARNQSNLNLAYATFKESSHEYQQVVLNAFQEVEDALNNIKFQSSEYESYGRAVQAAEISVKLSKHRFEKGLVNNLEVIDNELTAVQSDLNFTAALGTRYISTIQLIKALGGSW